MKHQEKPLLQLPNQEHSRHQFQEDLIKLLKVAGCSYSIAAENGRVLVSRRTPDGAFLTLDDKSLADACNSVARFHRGEGEEQMPRNEVPLLLESRVISKLPYRWDQARRFLRATKPEDRVAAEETFEEYRNWCRSQGEEPVVLNEGQYVTAIRDTWQLLG